VNDNAPDSALKKVTRTAGAGGKAFKRSSATVAQIEVNNFINQGENTSDILREAFYQSMIPDQVYNGAMLNHIYVDERWVLEEILRPLFLLRVCRGAIFIKKNEDYQELLEQNAVKADKKIKKANHKGLEKKWFPKQAGH